MKLRDVLKRLQSMPAFSKPHICWPSGELMKTDEGKEVLSEMYRVCQVVPINVRHATTSEVHWLQGRATEQELETALIYDPYKAVPVGGNPDPAGEHGDLIREEVELFVDSMAVIRDRGVVADYMSFDQERFIVGDGTGHYMTNRLNDFYRLAKVFQPKAAVFWYADGPIPNWNMERSKWITPSTLRDGVSPRCYAPQRPEVIIKQLGLMVSGAIYPFLSLGSGYTIDPHAWEADLHYNPECDRVNARVMRDDDRIKAISLYPQPGEPLAPRYWNAFFAYAEGWA